jgi:peroxiredoxin
MRFIKHSCLVIILLLIHYQNFGAEIKFNAPEYSGSSFVFYTIPNFLTENQEIVGEGTVDENGDFSCTIDISGTMPVYSEFGVYRGWIIIEPDKTLEIILPPKEEKQSSNPYFRPKTIHFGLKNGSPDNVNLLISNFNRQYNMQMSQNMQEIFYRRSIEAAEKVVENLKGQFAETNNEYFENFKKYKYANTKYTALMQSPEPIIEEFFTEQPILYTLPEYSDLFDKIFGKHLQYATQQVNGQRISVMLNSGAYEQLMDWLTVEESFNTKIAEAIIIKGIKPLFYSKRFNTVGLFTILQRITDSSENETHQTAANRIFNELAQTQYGAVAPELALLDINGNYINWDSFDGKYVYLCFTRTDNVKFNPHKELIKEIQNQYKDDLSIVIVIEDDDIEKNADKLESDGFEWTILRGQTRREVYQSFNVRIMPTYFLVDPQGRMAGSQAPWPDENFEMQFANVLRATNNNR